MIETWILCPVCDSKTRVRIREDTVLENFPLYCPKCKHATLISARRLNISVIKEPITHKFLLWLSAFLFRNIDNKYRQPALPDGERKKPLPGRLISCAHSTYPAAVLKNQGRRFFLPSAGSAADEGSRHDDMSCFSNV